jgi:hypothetical protein
LDSFQKEVLAGHLKDSGLGHWRRKCRETDVRYLTREYEETLWIYPVLLFLGKNPSCEDFGWSYSKNGRDERESPNDGKENGGEVRLSYQCDSPKDGYEENPLP